MSRARSLSGAVAWSALPVDQLSIPVAGVGFPCLGATERKHMTYELIGSGLSGFRGFGVDEFADTKAMLAAQSQAAAVKKASLTSTFKPTSTSTIKGIATLFSGATATKPPTQTLVAPTKLAPLSPVKLLPTIGPLQVVDGPATCSPGYVQAPNGTCQPAGSYAPAPEEDNTTMYLVAGGLVVALGTAAFFMTRKGK